MKVLECSPDSKNTFVYIFPSLNLQFQKVVVESRVESALRVKIRNPGLKIGLVSGFTKGPKFRPKQVFLAQI